MRFTIPADGDTPEQEYDVDLAELTVPEARLIKKHTDLGLRGFFAGIREYDVDAWLALIMVAKKRNNEAVTWNDLQHLNFMAIANSHAAAEVEDLQAAIDDAIAKQAADDDEESPGPTEPAKKPAAKKTAGKTRKRA